MQKFGRIYVAEFLIVASCLLATSFCEGPSGTDTRSDTAPKDQPKGGEFGYFNMALTPLGLQTPTLKKHQREVAKSMIANGVNSFREAFMKQGSTHDKPS
ncbi:hypothetical protein Ddc_11514 [Ditylenchus destructor]|nr:hypothetical protein Ddc_11514 [Ditylenchus destructor]